MGEVINDLCGGMKEGRKLKAVIPGGSSAKVLRADEKFKIKEKGPDGAMVDKEITLDDIPMDFDTLAAVGSMAGSGGVIVMDDSRDMVETLANINEFYAHESCGQCTPCREGSLWMKKITRRMVSGEGAKQDPAVLKSVADNIAGKTICAFGEACAWPTQSFVAKFKDEFDAKAQKNVTPREVSDGVALQKAGRARHGHEVAQARRRRQTEPAECHAAAASQKSESPTQLAISPSGERAVMRRRPVAHATGELLHCRHQGWTRIVPVEKLRLAVCRYVGPIRCSSTQCVLGASNGCRSLLETWIWLIRVSTVRIPGRDTDANAPVNPDLYEQSHHDHRSPARSNAERAGGRRLAPVSQGHAGHRGLHAGGQVRAALLLSPEAFLAGQLPHVPDRNGHAQDGRGPQTRARADGKPVINWIPRPQISCAQDIAEGMGIRTDSPMAQECRKGVMEFLLINHPLDCPICDQAGECRLQEFSVEYGNDSRAFSKRRSTSPSTSISGRASCWTTNAASCARAASGSRKEIAKDDALGFRGSRQLHDADRPPGAAVRQQLHAQHRGHLPGRRADLQGFPLQDARLVPQGNEEHLHELRDGLQHRRSAAARTWFTARPRARTTT